MKSASTSRVFTFSWMWLSSSVDRMSVPFLQHATLRQHSLGGWRHRCDGVMEEYSRGEQGEQAEQRCRRRVRSAAPLWTSNTSKLAEASTHYNRMSSLQHSADTHEQQQYGQQREDTRAAPHGERCGDTAVTCNSEATGHGTQRRVASAGQAPVYTARALPSQRAASRAVHDRYALHPRYTRPIILT